MSESFNSRERVLAVETLRLLDEVRAEGGGPKNLGVAVAGLLDLPGGPVSTFTFERGSPHPRFANKLNNARRIVGFGIRRFDLPVLSPYLIDVRPISARSVDLMEAAIAATGERPSLSNMAATTLGLEPLESGIASPLEWRSGNRGAVLRRLTVKLEVIAMLHNHSLAGGELSFRVVRDGEAHILSFSVGKR